MICPKCGAVAREGARFCENDGTRLIMDNHIDRNGFGICRCGAGPDAIDENGFCTECGIRRDVRLRDHIECEIRPNFAGATDRGHRHSENQDDFAITVVDAPDGPIYIAVVCDGVSGSEGAADASAAAAHTACAEIEEALKRDPAQDLNALLQTAILEANDSVCHVNFARGSAKDPPETTLVAAIVRDKMVTLAWVGDSRAYWISTAAAGMLTRDHSWINAMVDSGEMTEAEANQSLMRHAIVRCLGGVYPGADVEPPEPDFTSHTPAEGETLMLCSDGLWNYAEALDDLAELVRQDSTESPLDSVRRLLKFANDQGGKDNITAVILQL